MAIATSLMHKAKRDGVDRLADEDLLAIVLSRGRDEHACRQIASLLLDDFGGLPGIWRLVHGHTSQHPLNEARATRLTAAFELTVRCLERRLGSHPTVRCSGDVVRLLGPRLSRLLQEQLWIVALDGRNRVINTRKAAEGGTHGCALLPQDVLRPVLSVGASAFVLVHNHPGGDPTPSPHDLALTARILEAGRCVGVPLIDHVIISGAHHRSLLDDGIIPSSEPYLSLTQPTE